MLNQPRAATAGLANNAPVIVAGLLVVDSLHFVFARLLLPYLPPVTSVLYVLAIATGQVAFFLRLRDTIRLDLFLRHAWFFLSIGFLVAVSITINYTAVAFIDPGTASLLGQTSVLFGLGLGLLWLRERLVSMEWIGAAIAIGGVFIISFQPGDYLRLGAILVLISALMYAAHAALVKRYGAGMGLAEFFLFRLAATTGFLLVFTISRNELIWPGWQAGLLLLLAGTVDVTISRALYYLTLRRLRLSVHAVILTLSPVATIGWTLLLFGLKPTPQQLIGGAAVIGGVMLVTLGKLKARRLGPAIRDQDG